MSSEEVPLVFVHAGNRPHLARALAMARTHDPARAVILVGDEANRALARSLGVRHVAAADHSEGARRLDATYIHHSTHGRDFELACLQRWFLVLEWMESEKIERVVCFDSDVLLYAPLAPVLDALAERPMTMVIAAAHVSAINQRSALAAFCRLVESYYGSPEEPGRLEELHREHLAHSDRGGVSDMTFLRLFLDERPDLIASTPGPHGQAGWMLDLTINDNVGGFEMDGPFKRIVWRGGVPNAHRMADEVWLPFLALHFQGVAKRLVPRFTRGLSFGNLLQVWRNDLRLNLARSARLGSFLRRRIRSFFPR